MREQVAQTVGAPEELYLGSQVESLRGNCYKSSARVSNESKERHARCSKPEQCREDTDELKSHLFLVHFSNLFLFKKTDLYAETWNN